MDPFTFSLIMAWFLVRGAKEVPYAIRGKTSPAMQLKLAKARMDRGGAPGVPVNRTAARDFFSALWADAWDSGHQARVRMRDARPTKKAEGRLWWQRAGRTTKAVAGAWQAISDWAMTRKLPDLPDLDKPTDFARAADTGTAAADGGGGHQASTPPPQPGPPPPPRQEPPWQAPPQPPPTQEAPPWQAPPPPPGWDASAWQAPPPPRQEAPSWESHPYDPPLPEPGPVQATATRMDDQPPVEPARPQIDANGLAVLDAEVNLRWRRELHQ